VQVVNFVKKRKNISACFSNPRMKAIHSTKTLVNFYQTTWHHIPGGGVRLYKRSHETRSVTDRKSSIKARAKSHENPQIEAV
jgi:hypothetical protein